MRVFFRQLSVRVSRFAEAVSAQHIKERVRRIRDYYITPGLWGVGLAVAGIVLSLGALYSMTFIILGIAGMYGTAGTSIEDLEWRGWLGIGLATCVPVFMVWRALGKLKAEVELNHRLMKSSRGHDLIAKWYVVLERRPVVQSQTAGGRGHRDHADARGSGLTEK